MTSILTPNTTNTTTTTQQTQSMPQSASHLISLLSYPDPELQQQALQQLIACVDDLWHEISDALLDLEALSEDVDAPDTTRKLAAAVASRVFFHLEEPVQALRLALEAGGEFLNVHDGSAYTEALITAAMEVYTSSTGTLLVTAATDAALDEAKLLQIVELMLERCYADGKYEHALGIALEARNEGKLREILQRVHADALANNTPLVAANMLSYALQTLTNSTAVSSRAFRTTALAILVDEGYRKEGYAYNRAELFQCLQALDDADAVCGILVELLDSSGAEDEEGYLLGYQLCFDLVIEGSAGFVAQVAAKLPKKSTAADTVQAAVEGEEEAVEVTNSNDTNNSRSDEVWSRYEQAQKVLTGGFVSELTLQFLYKHNDADPLIMSNLKKSLESSSSSGSAGTKNSVLHNAAVMTHAVLNAGTTNDAFLRDDLAWMRKANNWARFSAVASLGVIHANHTTEAMTLLEPYLPKDNNNDGGSGSNAYAEGGALYALGLIHASTSIPTASRTTIAAYLQSQVRAALEGNNETLLHGASLGLGLVQFGTMDMVSAALLKEVLYTDSAVAGEASGIGLGLILCGHAGATTTAEMKEYMEELQNYAQETQHEKIIRGIALGLALMHYGLEEQSDAFCDAVLLSSRDPILRYGGMYTLALAYIGTGNNAVIQKLLHAAVSDVSNDVRMASVIALAFVLHNTPDRVPELVQLLLESFNAHVRYAACMAIGIAMTGTFHSASLKLLEPMLDDPTDFVRQGAMMGSAMILQTSNPAVAPESRALRDRLVSTVGDKHMSVLTKMGAVLATGILDAGGRNVTSSISSSQSSAVGMALFLQHWYWYPMMHMLSLSLTDPASACYSFGLTGDFHFPKSFQVQCLAKKSLFAYPKKLEEKKEERKIRVETVWLSTTAKSKAREMRKGKGNTASSSSKGGAEAAAAGDGGAKSKAREMRKGKGNTTSSSKGGAEAAAAGDGGNGGDGVAAMDVEEEKASSTLMEEGKTLLPAVTTTAAAEPPSSSNATSLEQSKGTKKSKKHHHPSEANSFIIANPSRVTSHQVQFCKVDSSQRYVPVVPEKMRQPYGVIVLRDTLPDEAVDKDEMGKIKAPTEEFEAEPPEEFEWAPPGHPEYVAPTPIVSAVDEGDKEKEDDAEGDVKMEEGDENEEAKS
eukprot:CAMPEP_0196824882 /NCGR_PEP_ID=MMETSP1362-20130617/92736_1 /TAXON_ID=163516 /ORGANISM="Leptocylindrus danicus, Strain CCMP1856" /LENGTH=1155 /DNA_ID=CAMNT_0042205235 /DNA_START=13 /DNA_END=3479 /DNA_ORIENTATION=-